MSYKNMSDILNEAHQKHISEQNNPKATSAAPTPFNPIQAYADQLPAGSKKPRSKRR